MIRQISEGVVEYDTVIAGEEVTITLRRSGTYVSASFHPSIPASASVTLKVINNRQAEISVEGRSRLVDI